MSTTYPVLIKLLSEFDKKGFEKASDASSKLAERAQRTGKTLTLGLTMPLLGAGGAALKMAMNAVESENLFSVSMGKSAAVARKWSEGLREQLGLNSYEVRRNVATFNQMLISMGMGEKASFGMAKGLTQLSYDMASFYNLKPEEAFEKLQAGISGEIEPLKRLGIVVNETTVEHYAFTHGIAKQGEKLSEQQKILARYGAIMDATKNAQGDLARTIDSPTNKLRIMAEQAKSTAIDFGTALIPALNATLTVVKPVANTAGALARTFSQAPKPIQYTGAAIIGLAAAVGPVTWLIGKAMAVHETWMKVKKLDTTQTLINAAANSRLASSLKAVGTGLIAVARYAAILALAFLALDRSTARGALAQEKVEAQLKKTGEKAGWLKQRLMELNVGYSTSEEELQKYMKAHYPLGYAIDNLVGGLGAQSEKLDKISGSYTDASRLSQDFSRALQNTGDAASTAEEKLKKLVGTNEEYLSLGERIAALDRQKVEAGLSLQQSQIDLTRAQSAYNEAIAKYGENSTEAAEARIGLRRAELAVADAQDNLKVKSGELATAVAANEESNKKKINETKKAVSSLKTTWEGWGPTAKHLAVHDPDYIRGQIKRLKSEWDDWSPRAKYLAIHDPSMRGKIQRRAAGGRFTSPHLAFIAEEGYPEYAISTDPRYLSRSRQLVAQAARELGMTGTDGAVTAFSASLRPAFAGAASHPVTAVTTNYSFAGATFVVNVPGGRVNEFISELDRMIKQANLRR